MAILTVFQKRRIEPIIAGGSPADGRFPECAALGDSFQSPAHRWMGSGVLIERDVLLTVAHLATFGHNRVALPADDLAVVTPASARRIRCFRAHAGYTTAFGPNDVALISLCEPVQGVLPAQVASADDLNQIAPGTKFTLVGFGPDENGQNDNQKRFVDVRIRFWRGKVEEVDPQGFGDDEHFIVGEPGLGACVQDSGGGVYLRDTAGNFKLAGLVRAGTGDNCASSHTIAVRVTAHADWIGQNVPLVRACSSPRCT